MTSPNAKEAALAYIADARRQLVRARTAEPEQANDIRRDARVSLNEAEALLAAGDPLPTYARRQATSNAKASRHDGRYGVDL